MIKALTFTSLIFLVACDNIGATETEVDAVQAVLNRYGGICHRYKGFETTNGITETYFELEMKESKVLENYSEFLEIPASNIAYLFYSNLGDEKDNYTYIKVKIILANGFFQEYCYADDDIETMEEFAPMLSDLSDRIQAKDYQGLQSDFDQGMTIDFDEYQIEALCSRFDSLYGQVIETQLQGFAFQDSAFENRSLIYLYGIMKREKTYIPISSQIDLHTKKMVYFAFEF